MPAGACSGPKILKGLEKPYFYVQGTFSANITPSAYCPPFTPSFVPLAHVLLAAASNRGQALQTATVTWLIRAGGEQTLTQE